MNDMEINNDEQRGKVNRNMSKGFLIREAFEQIHARALNNDSISKKRLDFSSNLINILIISRKNNSKLNLKILIM